MASSRGKPAGGGPACFLLSFIFGCKFLRTQLPMASPQLQFLLYGNHAGSLARFLSWLVQPEGSLSTCTLNVPEGSRRLDLPGIDSILGGGLQTL